MYSQNSSQMSKVNNGIKSNSLSKTGPRLCWASRNPLNPPVLTEKPRVGYTSLLSPFLPPNEHQETPVCRMFRPPSRPRRPTDSRLPKGWGPVGEEKQRRRSPMVANFIKWEVQWNEWQGKQNKRGNGVAIEHRRAMSMWIKFHCLWQNTTKANMVYKVL